MVWPPATHQDVEDELGSIRGAHRDYFRTGYYSTGTFAVGTPTGTALTVDTLYARPFWIGARRAFDRIGVNVSTAATAGSGGVLQLGLFEPGSGIPGPLAFQSASIGTETGGAKEVTIAVTLDPGVWWVGVRPSVAGCSVTGFPSNAINPFSMSSTSLSTSGTNYTAVNVVATGTGAFPTTGWGASSATPAVMLRAG